MPRIGALLSVEIHFGPGLQPQRPGLAGIGTLLTTRSTFAYCWLVTPLRNDEW